MKSYKLSRIVYCLFLFFINSIFSFSQINFISPKITDTLLTGRTTRIEWNNSNPQTAAGLYYSNDDGKSWILLSDSIMGNFYDWDVPLFDTLQLKLRIENNYSEAPVLIWEIPNAHTSEVRTVNISDDGKYALSAGGDSTVKIWDISSKIAIDSLKLWNQFVFGAYQFHSFDTIIIAFDSSAILWERLNRNTIEFGRRYFNNIVKSCAVNPTMPIFAAASYDGYIMIFSIQTRDTIAVFHSDDYSNIYTCSFSDDGTILLFSTYSGDTYIYDVNSKSLNMKLNSDDRSGSRLVWSSAISPDNKIVATGVVDGLIRLYDASTAIITDTLNGHNGQIRTVAFKSDGSLLLSGSLDGTIRQWYINSGMETANPINYGSQVLSCNYSTTGDSIISSGRDGSIKLWKNFKYFHYEDSIDCTVKYPLRIKIPDIYSKAGDFFRIQLLAESLDDIPKPNEKIIDFKAKLEYPAKLMDFRDSTVTASTSYQIDTAGINISVKALSDTLSNILALALFDGSNSSKIRILDFAITNSNDYYIEKDDGSITLSSSCEGNSSRVIQFSNSALSLDVSPLPVESVLNVKMHLVEKGSHSLMLFDINGNLIKELLNTNFNAGDKEFKFDVSRLQPGYYHLILKAPSEFKSNNILIIR